MPKSMFQTKAHGKLLLTGEYFVLDGVPALAIPTSYGQTLRVIPASSSVEHDLFWRAYDVAGERWFSRAFDRHEWMEFPAQTQVQTKDTASRICQLLSVAEQLQPGCTQQINGLEVSTHLGFNRQWGLGSSSTLVAALASWLDINPYALLEATFGGSGYDLACATAKGPILYERNGIAPKVTELTWSPAWLQQTYFVYRNQKQDSRDGIRAYRNQVIAPATSARIGQLTHALINPSLHLRAAAQILQEHEQLVANALGLTPIQSAHFPDFPGQLKSLVAWGGDFFWALSEEPAEKVRGYFNERGYKTVIDYARMGLQ